MNVGMKHEREGDRISCPTGNALMKMKPHMRLWPRLLVVVLITGLASVLPADHLAKSAPRLPGCHHHQNTLPSHPVDFTCCQTGHHSAIVPDSPSSSCFGLINIGLVRGPMIVLAGFYSFTRVTSMASPPDTIPLRI